MAQCGVTDLQRGAFYARARKQPRPEMVLRDREFFLGDVAREADHFHAVQQRAGDGVQLVRGAHEQHLREIHAQIEVVVEELGVLLRIQRLEECGGGVALIARAYLVDLIQHDDRVGHLHLFQRLHELARHRADVGAAVSLDLGLVAHAAQREAVELAPQRVGDRAADGGLAHAWRTCEQDDRAADLALPRAHGDELQDALFHVFEPVVLACQHVACVSEVELVGGVHAPGHRGGPVEVVARHAVLGRASFEHREFIELVLDAFGHGGWRLECRHAGLEFLGVGAAVVLRKPQFLFDDFQLFFQEELALALADGLVYLAADLVLQPRDFDLFLQQRQHDPHAVEHIQRFQHVLQFAALGAGERGGKICER